jgi:hypothetical protein
MDYELGPEHTDALSLFLRKSRQYGLISAGAAPVSVASNI